MSREDAIAAASAKCTYFGCSKQAQDVRCFYCFKDYCESHDTPRTHFCLGRSVDKIPFTLKNFLERVKASSLLELAQSLRPGVECKLDLPEPTDVDSWRIGQHVHFPVLYADGSKMIARVRFSSVERIPRWLLRAYVDSDYATISAVKEFAPQFVPAAYRPAVKDDVLDYYLMDFQPGSPAKLPRGTVPTVEERKTLTGLAEYMVALSSRSFSGIGSLRALPSGDVGVGPLLPFQVFAFQNAYPLGPFKTNREAKGAQIDFLLAQIRARKLYWTERDDPVTAYLVLLEARAIVYGVPELGEVQPTYIRHGDDASGDNLLVLEDGTLSSVIDWELAYTCPFAEAFSRPLNLRAGADLLTLSAYEEFLIAALERLDRPDLADAVRGTRKYDVLNHVLKSRPGHSPRSSEAVALRVTWLGPGAGMSEDDWGVFARARFGRHKGFREVVKMRDEMFL